MQERQNVCVCDTQRKRCATEMGGARVREQKNGEGVLRDRDDMCACSVLQSIALCCSVLQCVTVCYSM